MAKAKEAVVKNAEVKTVAELEAQAQELQIEHRELQRSHRMGELVNPRALTVKRKEIARALTALNAAKRSQEEK